MSSNVQKTPFAVSLNEFAKQKATSAIQLIGKALGASVVSVDQTVGAAIVTVQFTIQSPFTLPNVTIPLAGAEYIRWPLQKGCKGVVFPADTFIGNISGLGPSSAPSLVRPGNLAALVFFPLGNKNWTAPMDKTSVEIYGAKDFGAIIHDNQGSDPPTSTVTVKKNLIDLLNKMGFEIQVTDTDVTLSNDSGYEITIDDSSIKLDDGTDTIELTGSQININAGNSTTVNINGRVFLNHVHSTSGPNTGPVV